MAKITKYLTTFRLFVMLIHCNKTIYILLLCYVVIMFLLFKEQPISFIMPVFSISYIYNYTIFYTDMNQNLRLLKKVYSVDYELFSLLKILFIYILNMIIISCLLFFKESTLLIIVGITSYSASFLLFSVIYFSRYVLKSSK